MERCKCCGLTSSAGKSGSEKYYNLLKQFSLRASLNKDQCAMVEAAQEYLSNITTMVSSSDREGKIPYERNLFDLQQAYHLLGTALEVEDSTEKE